MLRACTCAESEAGLFAHVAQADGDAVSSAGLQAFQQVLHRVVLGGELVVPLRFTDRVPHVDRVRLQAHGQPERDGETQRHTSYGFPVSTHETIGFRFF